MAIEQKPEISETPITLAHVLDELMDNPETFDGSHEIREAVRKTGANLKDVDSEIACLREQLTASDAEYIDKESATQLRRQLLSAIAVRAILQMPGGRPGPR